ncbi:histidinol-phosphate transaminase [Halalkalirubrum salinum]|uniref:histidinol-phosphate transaminase n=1 Tax=Halalkalirubrum salinum TaxID=2563889 RepID=UPI0010FBA671|nr:histidinol-phosphate transaminase [Halalkalirubrum salinum]
MQTRDLSSHSPYVPGRGIEEVARDLGLDPDELIKLSSNENPHGSSPKASAVVIDATETTGLHVYPKASHTDLTTAIAGRWDVADEQVWLTPGADGAIDLLSRAFLEPSDVILESDPGFAYYSMSARYHHGTARTYDLSKADGFAQTAELVLDTYDGERIVYLTTPHNPTGSEFSREAIETVAAGVDEHTLIVIDEAYGEYSERPSSIELVDSYENIAVLRTFSKAYGLAGLRIGYAIVPSAWADAYARVNTPFAANELACQAALAALEDHAHVDRSIETARWAREYMRENLDAKTWDSAGNFVLADVGDAETVAGRSQERGVIIRDCTSFGLPECVRISCGTEAETRTAVDTLNKVLSEVSAQS